MKPNGKFQRQSIVVSRNEKETNMHDFLATHAALIVRLAGHFVGRSHGSLDPGDVAHDVIVSLLRMHAQGSFDPQRLEHPEAYLRVVVRNTTLRAGRRGRRAGELTFEGDLEGLSERSEAFEASRPPSPEEQTRAALDARRLLDSLKAKLRPRDAVALALLVEDGLSIEETAAALGTTANNVYQMRHRILGVARELDDHDEASASLSQGRAPWPIPKRCARHAGGRGCALDAGRLPPEHG